MMMSDYDIRETGALGDGGDDTAAIQRAIDAACAAGGGRVVVPPGSYRAAALRLGSGVDLHLGAGAVLKGLEALEAYDPGRTAGGLIYCAGAEHVSISGAGRIDGSGTHFHDPRRRHDSGGFDASQTRQGPAFLRLEGNLQDGPWAYERRPGNMVVFMDCRDVHISGITLADPPAWGLHIGDCTDVRVHGLRIDNHQPIPNNDGIHITNSSNVAITDCLIDAGDDCIAITGIRHEPHFGPLGHSSRSACEDIVVANCVLRSRSSALRIGWGQNPVRNVAVSNIVIRRSNRGICISSRSGGVHNVTVHNAVIDAALQHGHWWGRGEALHLSSGRLQYPGVPDPLPGGPIDGVTLSGLRTVSDAGVVVWSDNSGDIRNIRICDSQLDMRIGELDALYGGNFDLRDVAEAARRIFDAGPRGAIHLRGVHHADLHDLRIGGNPPTYVAAPVLLDGCDDVNVRNCTTSHGDRIEPQGPQDG